MDRAYNVFNIKTNCEDITNTPRAMGITQYCNVLDNSIFSRNLKNNQAIIFKGIKVIVVNAEKFQKQKDKFENLHKDVRLANFQTTKENKIIKDKSEHSVLSSCDNWGLHKTNIFNTSHTSEGVNVVILDTGFNEGHPDYPCDINIYKTLK